MRTRIRGRHGHRDGRFLFDWLYGSAVALLVSLLAGLAGLLKMGFDPSRTEEQQMVALLTWPTSWLLGPARWLPLVLVNSALWGAWLAVAWKTLFHLERPRKAARNRIESEHASET